MSFFDVNRGHAEYHGDESDRTMPLGEMLIKGKEVSVGTKMEQKEYDRQLNAAENESDLISLGFSKYKTQYDDVVIFSNFKNDRVIYDPQQEKITKRYVDQFFPNR